MGVQIERVYHFVKRRKKKSEHAVLVDRIWPRGIAKADLDADEWLRDIGPSHELRKWFAHDPARWEGFRTRYRKELESAGETIARLRRLAGDRDLVLLYGARDETHNQAAVLAEIVREADGRRR